jgi:hypothetical protein
MDYGFLFYFFGRFCQLTHLGDTASHQAKGHLRNRNKPLNLWFVARDTGYR